MENSFELLVSEISFKYLINVYNEMKQFNIKFEWLSRPNEHTVSKTQQIMNFSVSFHGFLAK